MGGKVFPRLALSKRVWFCFHGYFTSSVGWTGLLCAYEGGLKRCHVLFLARGENLPGRHWSYHLHGSPAGICSTCARCPHPEQRHRVQSRQSDVGRRPPRVAAIFSFQTSPTPERQRSPRRWPFCKASVPTPSAP